MCIRETRSGDPVPVGQLSEQNLGPGTLDLLFTCYLRKFTGLQHAGLPIIVRHI